MKPKTTGVPFETQYMKGFEYRIDADEPAVKNKTSNDLTELRKFANARGVRLLSRSHINHSYRQNIYKVVTYDYKPGIR